MGGVLIAIDQLGNAVAGGNPDATISARTWFFANKGESHIPLYWKIMEWIINFAFYPVHGPDHCHQAYIEDIDECNEAGSDFMRALLGVIIILFCVPIALITRVYVLIFQSAKFDYIEEK